MAQTNTEQGFLPNGLHTRTLDFLFVTLAAVRDKRSERLAHEVAKGEAPSPQEFMHDVSALATVSAIMEALESARDEATPTVIETAVRVAPEARANFSRERAEKEAFLMGLMDAPKDERDIN